MSQARPNLGPGTSLRVLTINLFNGRARPDSLGQALSTLQPDVVAAQELSPNAARVLERHYAYGRLEASSDFDGMGIASAGPVSVRQLDMPGPKALAGKLSGDGLKPGIQPLQVICARLPPPLSPSWVRTRSVQTRLLREEAARREGPMALAGDLNATPAWPAYRQLTSVFCDEVGQLPKGSRPGRGTWPSWRPLLRIDHCLTLGAAVISARTVRIAGTDHLGLFVELGARPRS